MILKKELENLARKEQTSLVNIYREYVQNVFLSFLYQHKEAAALLFKGGTALRLAYKSPRYSEDLDFTLKRITLVGIEKIILKTLRKMETMSFHPGVVESKGTSGGYLGKFLTKVYDQEVMISIQGSTRKGGTEAQGEVKLITNVFIPDYPVYLLREQQLIGEKIEAALTRAKPRDFFDVYFLSRKGAIPVKERGKLAMLPNILRRKKIDFSKELGEFLPFSYKPLIKDFENIFTMEMKQYSYK